MLLFFQQPALATRIAHSSNHHHNHSHPLLLATYSHHCRLSYMSIQASINYEHHHSYPTCTVAMTNRHQPIPAVLLDHLALLLIVELLLHFLKLPIQAVDLVFVIRHLKAPRPCCSHCVYAYTQERACERIPCTNIPKNQPKSLFLASSNSFW